MQLNFVEFIANDEFFVKLNSFFPRDLLENAH